MLRCRLLGRELLHYYAPMGRGEGRRHIVAAARLQLVNISLDSRAARDVDVHCKIPRFLGFVKT